MSKKRILWLFNHTSLRKFEVPLLIEMGYEVYCPKKWTLDFGDYSASISYEYDSSLSIPKNDLEYLNQIDFYNGLTSEVMSLINQYFDITFCLFYPRLIDALATNFSGILVLHAFGLDKSGSYTNNLYYDSNLNVLNKLQKLKDRFWFSATYDNISEIECDIIKKRTLFMPIGLSNIAKGKKWRGGDQKILFVSPKINSNHYYNKIYKDFKENFADIPHVIGGAQPLILENDSSIAGFLPQEQYEYNMTHLAAMFYHSQEPRHLHYHPLEAVNNGMPLVFMAGGMLDYVGGKDLPGRCKTIKEARDKLIKLSRGDKKLRNEILSSQDILLKQFTKEYCLPYWKEAMEKISESTTHKKNNSKLKKIAVLMPGCWLGGILDYSIRFALALKQEIDRYSDNVQLVFAYPKDNNFKSDTFKKLEEQGIILREYFTSIEDQNWLIRSLKLCGYQGEQDFAFPSEKYSILRDGMSDFQDCDYLFLMADSIYSSYPVMCFKPYSVVVHDYIKRYVSGVISDESNNFKIITQRMADRVLVTSKTTYLDAVAYSGVGKHKIILTPLLCNLPIPQEKQENFSFKHKSLDYKAKSYFIWSTNASPHKNHKKALEALEAYYRIGGSIECFITGVNTKYFIPKIKLKHAAISKKYVKEIQNKLDNSQLLKKHIHILGNLPKAEYRQLLAHAAFVFHPGYGDNGNFTIVDAANEGIPAVCSDYPAARDLAEFVGIEPLFVDPFHVDSIANGLLSIEKQLAVYMDKIPSHDKLAMASYQEKANDLYKIVKDIVGF